MNNLKKVLLLLFIFSYSIMAFGEEKILIAYFGRFGNTNYSQDVDATASASIVLNNGNKYGTTEFVGKTIQKIIGGNTYSIQTEEKYPTNFDDVITQARNERHSNYIPKLVNHINNFEDYDTVFIGYPVWGNTLPAPVLAFLEEYDFSNKNVITFCTHDGYGRGISTEAIKEIIPKANFLEGIALESHDIVSGNISSIETQIKNWLETINIQNNETKISISVNGEKINGILYNTATAKEFIKNLPQTISMYGYGGREYYGGIDEELKTNEKGKLNFEDGDITYCPQNNTIAIFYSQTNNPNLTMRVIPIGKVTDDLNLFHNLPRNVEINFSINN